MSANRFSGLKFLMVILVLGLVGIIFAGGGFNPLTEIIRDEIALLTDSRLPETSPRLRFSLTPPRDAQFLFDARRKSVTVKWRASKWEPSVPADSEFNYQISV